MSKYGAPGVYVQDVVKGSQGSTTGYNIIMSRTSSFFTVFLCLISGDDDVAG